MRVFADVQEATIVRSAALGLEATVYPGINEIDDEDFAAALIATDQVRPIPEQSLVTEKDKDGKPAKGEHEPHYAPQGQGLRLDLESARKSGVVDRASAQAHTRAAAAQDDAEANAEKARGIAVAQAALADPDSDGVFKAEVRRTPVVGTEAAHRLDLSEEERNEEIRARALGISKETQKALGGKRQGAAKKASAKPPKAPKPKQTGTRAERKAGLPPGTGKKGKKAPARGRARQKRE